MLRNKLALRIRKHRNGREEKFAIERDDKLLLAGSQAEKGIENQLSKLGRVGDEGGIGIISGSPHGRSNGFDKGIDRFGVAHDHRPIRSHLVKGSTGIDFYDPKH